MEGRKEFRFFWESPEETEVKSEVSIPIHVAEMENEIIVRAEMRGFRKENIQLNVSDGFIEIAASGSFEKTKETRTAYVQEKKTGAIRRAFTLPAKINPDKAEAEFKNGILTVKMEKSSRQEKKRRQLNIR